MPVYSYICRSCGNTKEVQSRGVKIPCPCGDTFRRDFRFSVSSPIPEHFNNFVGEYVSNDQQFRDALKRKSEAASERTGMTHNFQPVDPGDLKSLGVTEEGLYESKKVAHDNAL